MSARHTPPHACEAEKEDAPAPHPRGLRGALLAPGLGLRRSGLWWPQRLSPRPCSWRDPQACSVVQAPGDTSGPRAARTRVRERVWATPAASLPARQRSLPGQACAGSRVPATLCPGLEGTRWPLSSAVRPGPSPAGPQPEDPLCSPPRSARPLPPRLTGEAAAVVSGSDASRSPARFPGPVPSSASRSLLVDLMSPFSGSPWRPGPLPRHAAPAGFRPRYGRRSWVQRLGRDLPRADGVEQRWGGSAAAGMPGEARPSPSQHRLRGTWGLARGWAGARRVVVDPPHAEKSCA